MKKNIQPKLKIKNLQGIIGEKILDNNEIEYYIIVDIKKNIEEYNKIKFYLTTLNFTKDIQKLIGKKVLLNGDFNLIKNKNYLILTELPKELTNTEIKLKTKIKGKGYFHNIKYHKQTGKINQSAKLLFNNYDNTISSLNILNNTKTQIKKNTIYTINAEFKSMVNSLDEKFIYINLIYIKLNIKEKNYDLN